MKRARSFMKYRMGNRDANHASIRDGLRKLGYLVIDLASAGDGVSDLLVFDRFGVPTFVEVKVAKGKLRKSQVDFAARLATYDVRTGVARTLDEALTLVRHGYHAAIERNARAVDAKAAAVVESMKRAVEG